MINIALPASSNALPGEAERVTGLGLTYVPISVEWERPRPEQFEPGVGVLKALSGRKVWVHCAKKRTNWRWRWRWKICGSTARCWTGGSKPFRCSTG